MFSIVRHDDKVNKEKRRRIITVTFTDGSTTFDQVFEFSVETNIETIKKVVKQYLDEINHVPEPITGDITDVTIPTPVLPTQAELERQAWEANFAKLEKVKRLIDCGVLTGTETQVVTLRNKVKNDFKPTYLG